MVSFTVRMRFRVEDHAKVRECLLALTEPSRQEPGCRCYIPHFIDGDPSTVLIYEQYLDEAAVEAHKATEHFERLRGWGPLPAHARAAYGVAAGGRFRARLLPFAAPDVVSRMVPLVGVY